LKLKDKPHWLLIEEYKQASKMKLEVDQNNETIIIELFGEISNIPAIKNRKQIIYNHKTKKRIPVISKSAICKLYAMDKLYQEQLAEKNIKSLNFKSHPIFVYLICGNRNRDFDPINCMETVCDWLEPSNKKHGGKERGWGIGITEDDKHITSLALHSWQTENQVDHSTIVIKTWRSVKQDCFTFINSFLKGIENDKN